MARKLYSEEASGLGKALVAGLVVAIFCLIAWLTSGHPPEMGHEVGIVKHVSGLGAGRDQRGCMTRAGYVWCDHLGKCLRPWEESCPGGTDFCQEYCKGNKIQKGHGRHGVICPCTAFGGVEDR
uniref:Uncharacterized protein n=1 Tax=Noctiluca scintillans TaxID=2966 RepID=A0A7S1ACY6_NOCSC|mmetsp:Transcript_4071/g.11444  ORF Transcript_4071/g.11444 Transcript_4071/m.11444 type:complete len:124 (+) Transcript_4071:108-479(+)